jgi:hypothetical protein
MDFGDERKDRMRSAGREVRHRAITGRIVAFGNELQDILSIFLDQRLPTIDKS